jgi:hypothetical protein
VYRASNPEDSLSRPDYKKLSILKTLFPQVPILAVVSLRTVDYKLRNSRVTPTDSNIITEGSP